MRPSQLHFRNLISRNYQFCLTLISINEIFKRLFSLFKEQRAINSPNNLHSLLHQQLHYFLRIHLFHQKFYCSRSNQEFHQQMMGHHRNIFDHRVPNHSQSLSDLYNFHHFHPSHHFHHLHHLVHQIHSPHLSKLQLIFHLSFISTIKRYLLHFYHYYLVYHLPR